jgi:hypothetical protein
MPLFKDHGRQYPAWAFQEIKLADLATGVAIEVVDLPKGAMVVDGFIEVNVAFDDTTTATVSVGDAALATRYATTSNVKALGTTKFAVANLGQGYADGGAVTITPAFGTDDNTVGTIRIGIAVLQYGRAHETQPY